MNMNNLLENIYKKRAILTILYLILKLLFYVVDTLEYLASNGHSPKTDFVVFVAYIISLPLMGLIILSYILALISSIKQSKVVPAILYTFFLAMMVAIFIFSLPPI